MPTVFRKNGYRFFFFSREGNEPVHIHVEKGNSYAKIWIDPVKFAQSNGFKPHETRMLARIVERSKTIIREKWDEHFDL